MIEIWKHTCAQNRTGVGFSSDAALRFASFLPRFLMCNSCTIMKSFLKIIAHVFASKFRAIFVQIFCEFASDFFEKRLHYCATIASQKSCEKPANRRAASDDKPTPDVTIIYYATSVFFVLCLLLFVP